MFHLPVLLLMMKAFFHCRSNDCCKAVAECRSFMQLLPACRLIGTDKQKSPPST